MSLDLAGIIPPLVTPFTADGEIDKAALEREVHYMLDAGVDGITVTGSTGEGHTMTIEESCRVARIAIEAVAGRVPVISGIIQDSTTAAIRYGLALKEAGVSALQITPVHYLFTSGEASTLAYYDEIGRAVQLPIVVYNVVPWNTIGPATLLRLAELDWVVGVKQSGGDIHKLADLLRLIRLTGSRLRVMSAVDALLYPSFLLGAHGSVAGILTVAPRLSVELWQVCQSGNLARALEIHDLLLPVWRLMEAPDMPARVKAALELQGRRVGGCRKPLLPVTEEVREQIRAVLEGVS
jgi:4-hydroxy-tetrahydrodipicolinate synthase